MPPHLCLTLTEPALFTVSQHVAILSKTTGDFEDARGLLNEELVRLREAYQACHESEHNCESNDKFLESLTEAMERLIALETVLKSKLIDLEDPETQNNIQQMSEVRDEGAYYLAMVCFTYQLCVSILYEYPGTLVSLHL